MNLFSWACGEFRARRAFGGFKKAVFRLFPVPPPFCLGASYVSIARDLRFDCAKCIRNAVSIAARKAVQTKTAFRMLISFGFRLGEWRFVWVSLAPALAPVLRGRSDGSGGSETHLPASRITGIVNHRQMMSGCSRVAVSSFDRRQQGACWLLPSRHARNARTAQRWQCILLLVAVCSRTDAESSLDIASLDGIALGQPGQ